MTKLENTDIFIVLVCEDSREAIKISMVKTFFAGEGKFYYFYVNIEHLNSFISSFVFMVGLRQKTVSCRNMQIK